MNRALSWRAELACAAQLLALMAVYVIVAKLGLMLAPVSRFATLVWPPTGIALAALMLGGYRLSPAIAVGAFVTNLWIGAPLWVAFVIAAGNTAEAVVATFALRKLPGFTTSLTRFRDVMGFVVLAGFASTTISATVGVSSLMLSGTISPDSFSRAWCAWWTGDLLGDLIIAPLLLTWAGAWTAARRPRSSTLAAAAALGTLLIGSVAFVFLQRPEVVPEHPFFLPYVLFLPLIGAALLFGTRGAATAMFLVAIAAVWGTYTEHGAFVRANQIESLFSLNIFLAAASVTMLVLGSVVCELREKAAVLRAVIDGTPDAVYVRDRRGRYLIMNTAWVRLLGVPPRAPSGLDDAALFPGDEARLLRERDQVVLSTGQPRAFEESVTIAGQPRIFHSMKAPYRDRAGNVIGVVGISHDITERKSEELARAWLAAIVESSSDAVIGTTLDGTITSWNAAAERLFGHTREEAIGRPIAMIVPPERREELAGFFDRIRCGVRIENQETVRCRRDGTRIQIALTLSPICDSAGIIVGVSAISHDITARKRLDQELRESEARRKIEMELRESEERQRLAVEAAHLGVWCWNLEDDRLIWTPRCKSLHGVSPDDEVSYGRFLTMLHSEDREKTEQAIHRSVEEHTEYQVEHRVVWPDGSVHWLAMSGRTLCDEAGKAYRFVGVTLDITAQKLADQERAELLHRTLIATRAKDEFLAVLSHELRTPLQSMLGWTQLLKAPDIDPRTLRKGQAAIERNINLQIKLIDDLLDVSRIIAGKLRLDCKRVGLTEIVESAIASSKALVDAKALRIEATIEPLGREVFGDPLRLQQVVSNLLSNAVKFTPRGGRIGVRLHREGKAAAITISDTGCGISPELLSRVFDRFFQADSTTTRSYGGLGLGLAIVRQLVELQGGTVAVASPGRDRGSTFTVTLPLLVNERAAVAAPQRTTPAWESIDTAMLAGMRVLVVDDEPDACELLETVLQGWGADVRTVCSARAALDVLASFHPDVLMSDIGMPDEDGYALICQLRAREAVEGGHLLAVALTAFAGPADRDQAISLGFEAHLAKPASPEDVVRTVARLVGRAA